MSELTAETDPFALFAQWLAHAEDSEPNDPNAMALATVSPRGQPSVRMVLLKGVDSRGFVFFSNSQSAKGKDLLRTPLAGLCWHWKSLHKQVRAEGSVLLLAGEDCDAYFNSRSRQSQIGAWASLQSEPLASRAQLDAQVQRITERFKDKPVPRPPHWRGYRLVPTRIEFWIDGPSRLHDRFSFARTSAEKPWTCQRLNP